MTPEETTRFTRRLGDLLRLQATADGFSNTPVPGVLYARSDADMPRYPALYEPSIVILATGSKRAYLDATVHTLDPGQYWVVSVPMAFACETLAPHDGPLLGLSIGVDGAVLGELLVDMDDGHTPTVQAPTGLCAAPMSEGLAAATIRLAQSLTDHEEARVLGPAIVREILYRVLKGNQGEILRALVMQGGRLRPVARALRRMHTDYASQLDVERLASEAHMGVSTFHHAFRAVTATTPLQYLKTVRLHKARSLLTETGMTAFEAARRVGYSSPSQFSREFKRLFGASPTADAARLQKKTA